MEVRSSCHPVTITTPHHLDSSTIIRTIDQTIDGLMVGMVGDLGFPNMSIATEIVQLGPRPDYDEQIVREITVYSWLDIHENETTAKERVRDRVIVEIYAE